MNKIEFATNVMQSLGKSRDLIRETIKCFDDDPQPDEFDEIYSIARDAINLIDSSNEKLEAIYWAAYLEDKIEESGGDDVFE